MRKSNTPANIAAIEQLIRKYLLVTRRQCMEGSNTIANIAAMKQLQREVLNFTRRQCTKELNTLANIAAMKQLKNNANFCSFALFSLAFVE